MSHEQQQIDWPTVRGRQLRDLGMARFGDAYQRLIVRELDDFIRGRPQGWELTFQQLAERCEINEVTCRRKVAELVEAGLIAVEDVAGSARKRFRIGYTNLKDHARPRAKTRRGRRGQGGGALDPAACELHGATRGAENELHGATPGLHGATPGLHGATPGLHGATAPLLAHNRQKSAPPPRGVEATLVGSPRTPELPAHLAASPSFVAIWQEWLGYRRRRRLDARAVQQQRDLEFLAAYGADEATAMISQSLRCGWQGIHELRRQGGGYAASREEQRQRSNFAAFAEFLHEG